VNLALEFALQEDLPGQSPFSGGIEKILGSSSECR
jgi:hypothetical protein